MLLGIKDVIITKEKRVKIFMEDCTIKMYYFKNMNFFDLEKNGLNNEFLDEIYRIIKLKKYNNFKYEDMPVCYREEKEINKLKFERNNKIYKILDFSDSIKRELLCLNSSELKNELNKNKKEINSLKQELEELELFDYSKRYLNRKKRKIILKLDKNLNIYHHLLGVEGYIKKLLKLLKNNDKKILKLEEKFIDDSLKIERKLYG